MNGVVIEAVSCAFVARRVFVVDTEEIVVARDGHGHTENRKTKPNRTDLTDLCVYSVYGFNVRWQFRFLFGVRCNFGFLRSQTDISEETAII